MCIRDRCEVSGGWGVLFSFSLCEFIAVIFVWAVMGLLECPWLSSGPNRRLLCGPRQSFRWQKFETVRTRPAPKRLRRSSARTWLTVPAPAMPIAAATGTWCSSEFQLVVWAWIDSRQGAMVSTGVWCRLIVSVSRRLRRRNCWSSCLTGARDVELAGVNEKS